MKPYPSIPVCAGLEGPVLVFPKYDGSNVRAEWCVRRGWTRFGRRNGLLDASNPILHARVEPLIRATYGDGLDRALRAQGLKKATAYFEFFGPGSFAGSHVAAEPHQVMLLDIAVHRKGLMLPETLIRVCAGLPLPPVLHRGVFTEAMAAQVAAGTFPGQTAEGVILKANRLGSPGRPVMAKLKSRAWLEALRADCRSDLEFLRRR